jgi:GNAT superfamily N-acetyltransferase
MTSMAPTTRIGVLPRAPGATSAAVAVLAAAFRDGAVARWLEPDAASRRVLAERHFAAVVHHVLAAGEVVVATAAASRGEAPAWYLGGRLDGVALWTRHPLTDAPVADLADGDSGDAARPAAAGPPGEPTDPIGTGPALPPRVAARVATLRESLDARRPGRPHHYLAYLAVRPDQQCRGLGSALLARRHALLDVLGEPAYLEADDPRNRDLYLRHGYVAGDPVVLPDGPPLWPMWRDPRPGSRGARGSRRPVGGTGDATSSFPAVAVPAAGPDPVDHGPLQPGDRDEVGGGDTASGHEHDEAVPHGSGGLAAGIDEPDRGGRLRQQVGRALDLQVRAPLGPGPLELRPGQPLHPQGGLDRLVDGLPREVPRPAGGHLGHPVVQHGRHHERGTLPVAQSARLPVGQARRRPQLVHQPMQGGRLLDRSDGTENQLPSRLGQGPRDGRAGVGGRPVAWHAARYRPGPVRPMPDRSEGP